MPTAPARTVTEIENEMAALKAAGEHPRSGLMRGLRAALAEAQGQPTIADKTVEPEKEHVGVDMAKPGTDRTVTVKSAGPSPAPDKSAPYVPPFDVRALVMNTLAARAATGKSIGNVEQLYSALREAAEVGAIIFEALDPKYAGWEKRPEYVNASHACGIPPYEVLGRERNSGRRFRKGETQMIVDGIVAPPSGRVAKADAKNGDGSDRDRAMGLLGKPSLSSLGLGGDQKATLVVDGVEVE